MRNIVCITTKYYDADVFSTNIEDSDTTYYTSNSILFENNSLLDLIQSIRSYTWL